jgi:hypothetical protein
MVLNKLFNHNITNCIPLTLYTQCVLNMKLQTWERFPSDPKQNMLTFL